MTISGAYGRDYKNKADIEKDLAAGKDFVIRDFGSEGYANVEDFRSMGLKTVNVRYKADRSVAVIRVPA